MDRKQKTLCRNVVGLILLSAVTAGSLLPRGARLETYTSPPIKVGSEYIRYQVLIPSGWMVEPDDGSTRPRDPTITWFEPRPVLAWAPVSLRRFLGIPLDVEKEASLGVCLSPLDGSPEDGDAQEITENESDGRPRRHVAYRGVNRHVRCDFAYYRTNYAEFNATYRQICESFPVIR